MTELRVAPPAIEIRSVTRTIGADVEGVDLTQPLDDTTVRELHAALLAHRVLFFRDQHIDHTQQIAFARRFGELTYAHPHDATPPDGYPEIYTVDRKRQVEVYGERLERVRDNSPVSGFHSDVTPAINPPYASILRAEVVPDVGGDTTWTSLVAAYEGLSPSLRDLADHLWAEHTYGAIQARNRSANIDRDDRMVARHPVVRVHPETGERALYVNPVFTSHILDVSSRESEQLLDLFFEQLARPEHLVRFRWTPGSIAFWDNRTTAHQAPRDLPSDEPRTLHRVTLIGDVPKGPDGRASELVAGVPFEEIAPLAFAR